MKNNLHKLIYILLFGFIPFFAFAQTNDFSIGMLYTPVGYGDHALIMNTGYFKNISSKSSIGIIMDFGQYFEKYNEYIEYDYGEKNFYGFISLIYKYNFYKKGRTSLYYGTGLTFGSTIIYYETIPKIGVCGVGLPNDWEPPKPPNHWNYEYRAGIPVMFDFHYRIVGSLYAGTSLRVVACYDFESNRICPGIFPLLKIGYKW